MTDESEPRLPPGFRRLAWSNLSAQFSEQVALAAAPLAAVLLLGADASQTGYLQAAQTLPFLVLSLPAGVLADRASRRGVMVAAEALRAGSLFAILALLVSGQLNLPWLGLLGAAGAVGTVVYSVAAPALIPALVSRARLGDANRVLELARSGAFVAGPSLGGAMVGGMGPAAAYVLAGGLSLLAVLLLRRVPDAQRMVRARRHMLAELRDGAAFVVRHRLLRPILVTGMVFNLSWFVVQGVFVAYAVQRLGLTATAVGLTFGAYGAGMLAGALATPWLSRRLAFGTMIALGPASGLVAALLLAGTIVYPGGVLAGAGFCLFGAGPIVWTITTTTFRQAVTPGAMLGRISAVVMTATYGMRPMGAAVGALVAARYGAGCCLVVAAVGFAVQFGVIVGSSVPRLERLPEGCWCEGGWSQRDRWLAWRF